MPQNDLLRDIEALRAQGASEADIEEYARMRGASEKAQDATGGSKVARVVGALVNPAGAATNLIKQEQFRRGVGKGLSSAGSSLIDAAGWVADKVSPPQRTVADEVAGRQPVGKLRQFAADTQREADEFYNPQGFAGGAGTFAGRMAGDAATAMAGGAGTMKLLPGWARTAIQEGSGAKKAIAMMLANAPVDVAQGLAQQEGLVLPGRGGAVAENIGFSGVGSALASMKGMPSGQAPAPRPAPAAPEPYTPRATPETDKRRLLGVGAMQGPAIPTGPAVASIEPDDVTRRLANITPTPEDVTQLVPAVGSGKRPRSFQTSKVSPGGTPKMVGRWQKQREAMASIQKTAAQLERDMAFRRAFPSENADASASLTAAAEYAKRNAALNEGRIVRPGMANPQLVGALGGGAVGAAAGGSQGDTPQERALNAALGGLVGSVGGGMALGAGRRVSTDGPVQHNRAGKLDLGSMLGITHNTNEEGLKWMVRDPQLVAPSLAVMPEGASLSNFGHISLIGKTPLMDPKKVPVYKTDAYTPRASVAKDESAMTMMLPEKWDDVAAALRRTNWVGENELKRAGAVWEQALTDYSADGGPEAAMTEVSSYLAKAIGRGAPAETLAALSENDIPEVIQEAARKVLMDPYTGKAYDPSDKAQVLAHMKAVNGPDWRGQELLYNASGPLFGAMDAPTRAGRRKRLLDGYMLSVGPARALVEPRLKSLDEMRDWGARGVIGDGGNTQKLAEQSSIEGSLGEWATQHIDPTHTTHGREFTRLGRKEAFANAVREYGELLAKGKVTKADAERILMEKLRSVNESSKDGKIIDYAMDPALAAKWIDTGAKLLRRVFDAPVPYMEAQPKRLVGVDEFAGIVLPQQKDATLRDIAADLKLPFAEYKPGQYYKAPDSRAEVTKRFRRELHDRGERTLGFAAPEVAGGVGGAGIGAAAGAQEGDTPEERLRLAALGALGGGLTGAALLSSMRGKAKSAPENTKPTAYETALADQTAGAPKAPPLFNKSLSMLDPDGRRLWELEQEKMTAAGDVKQRVSDADIDNWAKDEDVDALAKSKLSKLTTPQFRALQTRIMEDRATYASLMDEFDKALPEQKAALSEQMDAALGRLINYDRVYNRAASEQGRGLRILAKLAAGRGTLESAMHAARKALGVPELSDEVTSALAEVMRNPAYTSKRAREAALAKVIESFARQPWWKTVLDVRRVGLLTAPATWTVNFTGNTAEAVNRNLIVTPVAAGLDRAWSAMTGTPRTVTTRGRGAGFASGARKGLRKGLEQWGTGMDPDNPLDDLRRQKADYVRDLKLSERDGDEAWRKTLRGGARVLQTVSDHVYGLMSATDTPFFEAALGASLRERASLRAQREGLKPGTEAFTKAVTTYSALENVTAADAAAAVFEAADDTFRTPTVMTEVVRKLGPPGEYFAPFVRTPTNLIRKAFESTPGLGWPVESQHRKKLMKQLAKDKASLEEMQRETRRARTLLASKWLTTGGGAVMAGFALSNAGVLSGEYTPPIGRDAADVEDAGRKALRNQGSLTIRVGDKAHSLNALAQFAPLLALGHALAVASREEAEAGEGKMDRALAVAGRSTLASGRTVLDLPLMQGAKNAVELFSGEKAGNLGRWMGREAATFIPASSAVATTARVLDPVAQRNPETFLDAIYERVPGLRERVTPKVGALGEVPQPVGALEGVLSPTRPTRVNTGPLYDALEEVGFYPTAGKKDQGEDSRAYAARRVAEGADERALLQGLLDGEAGAWKFVTPVAAQKFRETGEWKDLLSSALSRQRRVLAEQRNPSR